ncbi:MAG: carboxypeptidase-like regulatory domain-containing protein [Bacteroidota bacterium]
MRYAPSFLLLLIFFLPIGVFAQDILQLQGEVRDGESGMPLELATVAVPGLGRSVQTNSEGKFVLYLASRFSDSSITVSAIGFDMQRLPIQGLGNPTVILLEAVEKKLDTVLIQPGKGKRLSARAIVKKAYQAIEQNYPQEPYYLEGYVRDLQQEDGQYVEYMECAIKISYAQPLFEATPAVELEQVKRSFLGKKHPWNDAWDRKNAVIDLLEDECIRYDYGPIKFRKGWTYTLKGVQAWQGDWVYEIEAVKAPFQTARLFIHTEDFAFARIELSRARTEKSYYKDRLGNGQQETHYDLLFTYQKIQGKWYLQYQRESDRWEIYNMEEPEQLLFVKEPKKELFIHRVVVPGSEPYVFRANLKAQQSIELQAEAYDAAFWEQYNAPVMTDSLSEIARMLQEKRD